ncbi:alcohol dehydrogenase [Laetiporus sulphureus 93-53]|uniref:Alcohol dehydrogenase n=1 Tax=Laetiporus sulphureus 93-53 TaxID=1314785 RepID=A0A165CX52_9APHY|nr:alcohol dehydrogenase [Laetiporus sulphureus 93-53]KZT03634.1 alcohol dehydrogenase [Laetiporus sulphureus 93-53]
MAPVRNGRVLFNEIPTSRWQSPLFIMRASLTMIPVGSQTIDLENAPLEGGFLVKTLVLSIDPYIRSRMRDSSITGYLATTSTIFTIRINAVILCTSCHDVSPSYCIVAAAIAFQEYFVAKDASVFHMLENKEKLPWSIYIGVLGMPGQTAHHGWREFAHAKKGDVVFVTPGGGPIGATVIQLAKAEGLQVIASAHSENKIEFICSIGADVAFNYKTTKALDVLQKNGPINIYWDNVGGETLEAALEAAAVGARFIECGMISAYTASEPYIVKNLVQIIAKQLRVSGFIVTSLDDKWLVDFHKEFPPKVASDQIKYKEDVSKGLESAGQAILDELTGKNKKK